MLLNDISTYSNVRFINDRQLKEYIINRIKYLDKVDLYILNSNVCISKKGESFIINTSSSEIFNYLTGILHNG